MKTDKLAKREKHESLIYPSFFINNRTFCYFCKAIYNVLNQLHSLVLQVN